MPDRFWNRRAGLAIAIFLGLSACAPPYDEQADRAISDLQHQVDQKLVTLVSLERKIRCPPAPKASAEQIKAGSYDANTPFYDNVDADLTSAQMRIDAAPDLSTPKLDEAFARLRNVLLLMPRQGETPTSMRAVHAAQNCLSEPFLRSTRAQVNAEFAALLQYQVTVKNGKTPAR